MKTEAQFQSTDGKSTIWWTEWKPEGEIKAILHIVHGMGESIARFEEFAEYLNKYGVLVAGDDHIGHGRSTSPENRGFFGEKEGWRFLIEDEEKLHHILKGLYPNAPIFVFGSGTGSLIVRCWMSRHGKNSDGFILSGTTGTAVALGNKLTLVKLIKCFKGAKGRSKILNNRMVKNGNKRIKNPRTDYDWISTDEKAVDAYLSDPANYFDFTVAAYEDMLKLARYANEERWFQLVHKSKPILILSGAEDPEGDYGKAAVELNERLRAEGCSYVDVRVFESMRHEILFEKGKENVFEIVKDFVLA